jgi:hypothetical protein
MKAKIVEYEEKGAIEVDSEDEEIALLTKRFQKWARKKRRFSSRGNGSKSSNLKDEKEDQNKCFNCNSLEHFIVDCSELSSKEKAKKEGEIQE